VVATGISQCFNSVRTTIVTCYVIFPPSGQMLNKMVWPKRRISSLNSVYQYVLILMPTQVRNHCQLSQTSPQRTPLTKPSPPTPFDDNLRCRRCAFFYLSHGIGLVFGALLIPFLPSPAPPLPSAAHTCKIINALTTVFPFLLGDSLLMQELDQLV